MPLFKVFVLPSLTEGLPITMLEAMQEGVTVVATRVGGMARVLEDGKTGMLVSPGDDAALAEGIRQVLTDAEFAGSMRLAAEKIVADHYTSAAMAKQYSDVYTAALAKY
jgi:glycosyltransferase involved in cell wall biosynthesis